MPDSVNLSDHTQLLYRTGCQERVFHKADAYQTLPKLMDIYGYKRAFIVSSRTLNTKTDVIRKLESALGEKFAGLTDEVGSHAPLQNVLKAARAARDSDCDVIVGVGGGSVMDLCKLIQLCITENTFDKEGLLNLEFEMGDTILDIQPATMTPPKVRQIFIPTTMATAEWTSASTPKDEETNLKARFLVHDGAPQAIIYDPVIMSQTPISLLLSTAIRGLDHAINSRCSTLPHPLVSLLAEHGAKLFIENLPRIKNNPNDLEAMHACHLATTYTGMGVMSVTHGFSHWSVHVVGPYADIDHSDVACVMMLAQSKWLQGYADEQHGAILRLLGREDETLYDVLKGLLKELELPSSLSDIGLNSSDVDELAPLILEHPWTPKFNLREISTIADVKEILSYV